MRIIILMIVFLSFLVINVNAPGVSMCTAIGGNCYYGHQLNNEICPNGNHGIGTDEDGHNLCDGFEEEGGGEVGRDEPEDIYCCMPREDDGGDVNIDERVTLLSVRNIGTVRIGVNGVAPCCVAEGYAPDENELCCENKPLDYRNVGSGRCGCPNDMRWIITPEGSSCQPNFQRCGYVEERNVCTNLGYILTHPLECLFPSRNEAPYEQVCCPYIDYNDQEYYRFEDVVVY